MESIFLNGGFIGKTYDFGDTDLHQTGTTPISPSQQAYTTSGTFSWTAPAGVTSVSVVCVGGGGGGGTSLADASSGGGGGGLGWKNNIPVNPGQAYTVVVGAGGGINGAGGQSYFINASTVAGNGGSPGVNGTANGGAGGGFVGDGGGTGGQGGNSTITDSTNSQSEAGAGGGAGGYSGNGGRGAGTNQFNTGSAGAGGGGGGGGSPDSGAAGGGGGVGILGEGANGSGGTGSTRGGGGSGGTGGTTTPVGGAYGGGGAGADATTSGAGGGGAVRIIWGTNRAFPSTNTADNAGSNILAPVFGNQKNSGIWKLQSVYDDAPRLLLSDTFTNTDSTVISSHVPEYQAVAGTYRTVQTFGSSTGIQIISNTARGTSSSITTASAVIETGQSNVIVSCDVNKNSTSATNGGVGVAFRFVGSTGYFVDILNNQMRLSRVNGTTFESELYANFTHDTTTTYRIKVVLNGSNIKIYADNILYITAIDNTYNGTEHGFSVLTNATPKSWADNLVITTL